MGRIDFRRSILRADPKPIVVGMKSGFSPDKKNNGLVKRAGAFAAKAHAGQVRKCANDPYHVHLARVAGLLAKHELPDPVEPAGHHQGIAAQPG
jgi:(p)ppGpp synthase/HD superfamily hydrolase